MENNAINNSFSRNGISLQLRSKEVSEVMGNIPGWIGSWGAFMIIFFFAGSILLVLNIHLIERIPCKAAISPMPVESVVGRYQNLFLQVTVPTTGVSKIKTGETLHLRFYKENSRLYSLNNVRFQIDKKKVIKDSCIALLPITQIMINKIGHDAPVLSASGNVNCYLVLNQSVFQKLFGWLLT